jgi:perosamine synthetase
MRRLDERISRKKSIYGRYHALLKTNPHVRFFDQNLDCSSPWFIDVMVDERNALMAHLESCGIGTRPMYPPINRQEAYQLPGHFPISEQVGTDGLWLPSSAQLEDDQIDWICAEIVRYYSSKPNLKAPQ